MATTQDLIETYMSVWQIMDSDKRLRLIETIWSAESSYQDPTAQVFGPAGLNAVVDGFHKAFPGHRLVLRGGIDEHHGKLRFHWSMLDGQDQLVITGVDFAEVDDRGKLQTIVGFFNKPGEESPF
ncbi:MAG: hypothetical protein Kilf2KO_18050 [Rhodospirillales bacterium]